MGSLPEAAPVVNVLIAGGSYAGISAAVNLCDLGAGSSPRMAIEPYPHHPDLPRVDFRITIVDERDGLCTSSHFPHIHCQRNGKLGTGG